jgi:hypothetical protein
VSRIVGVGQFNGTSRAFLLNPVAPPAASTITEVKTSPAEVLIRFSTVPRVSWVNESRTNALAGTWSEATGAITDPGR